MNESQAGRALIELGIRPSKQLIQNWIRADEAERLLESHEMLTAPSTPPIESEGTTAEAPGSPQEPEHPRAFSRSNLEPVLRDQGTLEKPPKRRKAGRPRIVASWFPSVAQTMADGTNLRTALAINRLSLSRREMRACYRNRTFQEMYREARRRFLIEHYGRKPTLRAFAGFL